ncbi:MAG: rod shape-determining protein RodA [Puniceicoccales bacterium]|jgi:rod shape determining protein RodA|nr:rod shape-determining protein RodA [Puniceicoccales bacterium]
MQGATVAVRVVFGIRRRIIAWAISLFDKKSGIGFDPITPVCMLLLIIVGILSIHSAQNYHINTQWMSQIIWAALGLSLYLWMAFTDYKLFLKNGHWIYFFSIALLLCIFTPLGWRRFGATRWLRIGRIVIQPSEIAKLGTLVMGASILARSKIGKLSGSLQAIGSVLLVFGIPVILIMLQPDLGSSLPFLPIAFALLFVSEVPNKFFISILSVLLFLGSLVAWDAYTYHLFLDRHQLNPQTSIGQFEKISLLPLKDYQRNRIISFVAPDIVDPQGVGISWNLRQSLIAVGSGGMTGKGHGKGTQAKLGYLPQSVATNDFIFSVIAEEYGLIGGMCVLLIYAIMMANGLRIACMARDCFGRLLAVGISVLLLIHVCVNVGMTLGIMPITGIPLPFISYGGSFMVICCLLQGIIQSIYRFRSEY